MVLTEKEIFDKLHEGRQPPMNVLAKIVKKPLKKICVNPTYAYGEIKPHPIKKGHWVIETKHTNDPNEIIVIAGTEQQLQRAGVPKGHAGWAHSEKRTDYIRREVFINTDRMVENQILTLAHETGHHVLKNAVMKKVGKTEAERKAVAFEKTFAEEFNKEYAKYNVELSLKKTGKIKPSVAERKLVMQNIKPIFLHNHCSKK